MADFQVCKFWTLLFEKERYLWKTVNVMICNESFFHLRAAAKL